MSRRATILTLCVLLGLAGACSKQEQASDPAEEAFGALRAAWSEAETSEAKTKLAEDYLAAFPDTEYSGSMAGAIVYYRGNDLEDPEGAYEIVSAALEQIESPEPRFAVSMELLSLSDSVDVPLDVAQVANDRNRNRSRGMDGGGRACIGGIRVSNAGDLPCRLSGP